jgi:DNA-directed RNA polymerase subunit M/transcription elongation factor TFIIS
MENKYDNEFVRKQLYEIHGKSKNISYEDFKEELDKIVNQLNEQSKENDKFKKEYYEKHKLCPKCGSNKHTSTFVAYILHSDKKDDYKDLNKCVCLECGDTHATHDRV